MTSPSLNWALQSLLKVSREQIDCAISGDWQALECLDGVRRALLNDIALAPRTAAVRDIVMPVLLAAQAKADKLAAILDAQMNAGRDARAAMQRGATMQRAYSAAAA